MKKIILVLLTTSISTATFAQSKFSTQINTGYNYWLGTKVDKLNTDEKPSFGSLTSGTIPIEIEARYYINDQIFCNLNYAFQSDLGYSYSVSGASVKNTINPQSIKIGTGYYFSNEALKPYAGLDINVLLISIKNENQTSKSVYATQTTIGIGPKVGLDYSINEKIFINANLSYNFIISKVTDKSIDVTYTPTGGSSINSTQKASFENTNEIGITAGIGYKL